MYTLVNLIPVGTNFGFRRFKRMALIISALACVLSVAFYRYHVRDPVWFHKQVSFSISEQKFKVSPDPSDWSSTSFFYLNRPDNGLPEIQDLAIRTQDP